MDISILFVEDDNLHSKLVKLEMEDEKDWKVTSAKNATEAMAILSKESFNVIIIDLKLPDADGKELYEEMKRVLPTTPPVIFYSCRDYDPELGIPEDIYVLKSSDHGSEKLKELIRKFTTCGTT